MRSPFASIYVLANNLLHLISGGLEQEEAIRC